MPNWCNNELVISGDEENVAKAKTFILKDNNVDFSILSPMPESITSNKGDMWYNWAMSNWGVKWNVIEGSTIAFEGGYIFSTAWCHPDIWFTNLVDKLYQEGIIVDITLKYAEGGCWFGGEITNDDDGGTISNTYDDDEIRSFLQYEDEEDENQ